MARILAVTESGVKAEIGLAFRRRQREEGRVTFRLMRFLFSVFTMALALLAAGCSGDPISAREGAERKILLVNNSDDPRWLDLHRCNSVIENNVMLAIFEGLLVEGKDNERIPDPGVAERWESNEDKSVWTFYLRKDAKWSDGVALTAEDFLWSWRRLLNPKLAAEYSNMLFLVKNGREVYEETVPPEQLGAVAKDAHTLEVTLTGPTPHFPLILCHTIWCPVPRHCIEKYGDPVNALNPWTDADKMVTNGPFRMKRYLFRQYLEVEKNPHYWDAGTVKLAGIRFYPITSDQTEDRLFRRGQLHITYKAPVDKVSAYLRDHKDVVKNDPNLAVRFMRVNTTRPPLNDVRVRRALGLALNRTDIVENVLRANQRPATGVTPPMDGYDAVKGFTFDATEAARLLAEAGFPGGKGWPEGKVRLHIADSETSKQMAEAVQAMWKKHLGIHIPIRMEDYNAYLNSQQHMDYEISEAGWNADYYDPATFIDMWVTGGGNNKTGWGNKQFDQYLTDAGQATDAGARLALLRKAEELLLAEAPVLPNYWYTRTRLVHPSVVGWQVRLLDDRMWKYFDLISPPPSCSMDAELNRN